MMPLAVLRRIYENHRACKNECSLHGELRNWLAAYGDEKPKPRKTPVKLEELSILQLPHDSQRHFAVVEGNNGDVLDRLEHEGVAEALELAIEIASDAAALRDSIKTEQALGRLADYTDGFGKRFRELDVRLRKAGYR